MNKGISVIKIILAKITKDRRISIHIHRVKIVVIPLLILTLWRD